MDGHAASCASHAKLCRVSWELLVGSERGRRVERTRSTYLTLLVKGSGAVDGGGRVSDISHVCGCWIDFSRW